jgi:TRAP-type transport system periplasmic protein
MRALLLGVAGAAIAATAVAAENWKAYTYLPNGKLAGALGHQRIIEAVEQASGGELKIQLNLAGSLPIAATDITQAVADNIVQFGDDGFFLGNITIGGILRQPMLIKDTSEYAKALAVMLPYIEKAYAQKGVLVLGTYNYPASTVFGAKPITKLEDLAGKKLRMTSPEQAAFLKAFGGAGITISPPEVPSALQRGAVDGALTATSGGGRIWGDFFTHNFRLGTDFFQGIFIVNKAAFDKLKPEVQKALRDAVAKTAPEITAQMVKEDDETLNALKAKGLVATDPKPEEVAEATKRMQAVWEDWAKSKGPEHVKALAEVRQALGK